MELTFGEKIKIILKRRKMSVETLAGLLGTSKQNLNQQLTRDNFRYKDMIKICDVLGCKFTFDILENP